MMRVHLTRNDISTILAFSTSRSNVPVSETPAHIIEYSIRVQIESLTFKEHW